MDMWVGGARYLGGRAELCGVAAAAKHIDMTLIKFMMCPNRGFVARTVPKVEMGAERPISTPHQGVYNPPRHAPSTPYPRTRLWNVPPKVW